MTVGLGGSRGPPAAPRRSEYTGGLLPSRTLMPRHLALLASPAHLVVLLAFFLPFYEVSCQGKPLASSSAYELASGSAERDHAGPGRVAPGAGQDVQEEHRLPRGLTASLVLLPLLALAGGAAALWSTRRPPDRARASAAASAWLGAATALFLVVHFVLMRSSVRDLLQQSSVETGELARGFTTMMAATLVLSPEGGWYLALVAALAATALSAAAVFLPPSRPAPPGPAAPPPAPGAGADAPPGADGR